MIQNMDRSGYFGASDTKYVMSKNRNTKTWKTWWDVKLGKVEGDTFSSVYTDAGNKYEHPILRAINEDMMLDGQIIHDKYLLRVNYDGFHNGTIYEIKTHKIDKPFEITTAYWQQCQIEMFVYKEKSKEWFLPPFESLKLVSYGLHEDEYGLDWSDVEVDPDRIVYHPVAYDKAWVKGEYIPKIRELARALKKGKFPG